MTIARRRAFRTVLPVTAVAGFLGLLALAVGPAAAANPAVSANVAPASSLMAAEVMAAEVMATEASPAPTFEPAPDTAPNDGVRILFMGDSITGSPGCWRAEVWKQLTDAGYEVNMVGTRQVDECGGVTNAAGVLWDPDNSGIGSINTSGMFVKIARDGLLERTQPDMVVMLLGTNDFWGGADAQHVLDQYQALLDLMRRDHPTISLVIGTVLPMSPDQCPDCQAEIDILNERLPDWAAGVSTPESPVSVAVIHEGFDVATDTVEGVHPNDAGFAKVGDAWVPAIMAALDVRAAMPPAGEVATVHPTPSPSPTAGAADDEPGPAPEPASEPGSNPTSTGSNAPVAVGMAVAAIAGVIASGVAVWIAIMMVRRYLGNVGSGSSAP